MQAGFLFILKKEKGQTLGLVTGPTCGTAGGTNRLVGLLFPFSFPI